MVSCSARSWASAGACTASAIRLAAIMSFRIASPCSKSAAVLDRLAGDDKRVDLAGALVDAEQADVAIEPLDPVIGDIAGAAEALVGTVGDAADRLAGEIFGGGSFERDRLALVLQR